MHIVFQPVEAVSILGFSRAQTAPHPNPPPPDSSGARLVPFLTTRMCPPPTEWIPQENPDFFPNHKAMQAQDVKVEVKIVRQSPRRCAPLDTGKGVA